ncbi:hypothetical protein G6K93_07775 [Agrobacterium rhizogenes]|nr:hypothetical protein [Rhizobium rhizogenes]
MSEQFYVYVLFRPWDGSPFYVGKGKGSRWLQHAKKAGRHLNKHIASIFKKAQKLGLDVPAIQIRSELTEAEAFEIERALIASIGRQPNGPLANLTDGGEGASGRTWSEESKEILRIKTLGNKRPLGCKRSAETIAKLREAKANMSDETKQKISIGHQGKTLTEEHRKKLSIAHMGKILSDDHRIAIAAVHRGRKRSDETRQRMSAAQRGNQNNLGKPLSPETRAKIAAATKARWQNPDARAKMLASMRNPSIQDG